MHSQNWAVTQDHRGVLYVANTDGLLEYDGRTWRSIPLPDEQVQVMRSLATDPAGRIYVGGVGEIGYLAPDSTGVLGYMSLMDQMPEAARGFGDVWTTYADEQGVYFQTNRQIMRWDGAAIEIWTTDSRFLNAFLVKGTYFVREEGKGLVQLREGRLELAPQGEVLVDKAVYAVLPHPRGLLIGTRTDGFFLMTRRGLEAWPTRVGEYLATYRPYHAIVLDHAASGMRYYAIATFGGGVVMLDQEGHLVHVYREDAGLDADDKVLYLYEDQQGGLWLALDQGIRRIDVLSPLTQFDLSQGLEGLVADIVRVRDDLYVATSTGLFRLVPSGWPSPDGEPSYARFERVSALRTQYWALLDVEDALLAATNDGLYELRGGRSTRLLEGIAFSVQRSEAQPDRLFVGMEGRLVVLHRQGNRWALEQELDLEGEQVSSMKEDQQGNLWMTPLRGGVLQVRRINDELRVVRRYGDADGIGSGRAAVIERGETLYLVTQEGVLRIVPQGARAARFERETAYDAPALLRGEYYLHAESGDRTWLFKDRRIHRLEQDEQGRWIENTPPVLRLRDARVERVYEEGTGVTWFGTDQGLLRYDPAQTKRYDVPYNAIVRRVEGRDHDLLYGGGGEADALVMPHSENALRFLFAAPSFNDPEGLEYQFLLEGFDETWSAWSPEAQTEYTNLPEHSRYRFRVRARNAQGVVSRE
ncbi:MAG: hypothetical protein HKN04_07955, partial [Rhodothermaceae bacterium]|nr:hypothetical protein [Rhodothermaceae bacterium]